MKRLLIAGAGGHGRVVADLADCIGQYSSIAFLDDRYPQLAASSRWPVVGTFDELERRRGSYDAFAVALGDAHARLRLIERALQSGFEMPALIHPFTYVSARASVAAATVVCAGAIVGVGSTLGVGCIVNTGASVDHDCQLAEGVHVAPGARLGGGVSVGARSWIGIGACVRQQLTIGRDVLVAAGAVCVANVEPAVTVMGVPARRVRANDRGMNDEL